MTRISPDGMAMKVEFLIPAAYKPKRRVLLESLCTAARQSGDEAIIVAEARGGADLLVLYGYGSPEAVAAKRLYLPRKKHVVMFDIGYWRRRNTADSEGAYRMSIDHPHPQDWVMRRDLPKERWKALGIGLRADWEDDGPVIVVGMGPKARLYYGHTPLGWERAMIDRVRRAMPGRPVLYRPKPGHAERIDGVQNASGPIEQVLANCSLAVCHHSNVAIDCLVAGVPCVTFDGAAAAVLGSEIRPGLRPVDDDTRRRFLSNLAWYNWLPSEVAACWRFVRQTVVAA